MMQQSFVIIEAQQQRPNQLAFRGVAKPTNDALDTAELFHFHHPSSLTRAIGRGQTFCNDSVEAAANVVEPALYGPQRRRRRRKLDARIVLKVLTRKTFEPRSPVAKRLSRQQCSPIVDKQIECDEGGRRFGREFGDSTGGGMDPQKEIVE